MLEVLAFTARHWRRRAWLAGFIIAAIVISTLADVFVPVYAGRLVDAVTLATTDRTAAWDAAVAAFVVLVGLGAGMVVVRHIAFRSIEWLTLGMMDDVTREAFAHCSVSQAAGTPTPSPARRCASSRAPCGRSTCSTTRC